MATIGERIKSKRTDLHLTLEDVAKKANVSRQTIQRYESGVISNIPSDKIELISEILNVSPSYLMGWDDNVKPIDFSDEKYVKINVYGSVPAGVPVEAIEDIVDTIDIPESWLDGGQEYIGLRVSGKSMYPKYLPGDTIVIQLQDEFETRKDCVVYVNGYEATLKTVILHNDGSITLKPINPEFPEHRYGKDYENETVKMLGVVVQIRRDV